MIVRVKSSLLEIIEAKAQDRAPDEVCGLLVGHSEPSAISIERCVISDNVTQLDQTRHFEIDPSLHIKLQKELRGSKVQIVGVWHSHPNGNATLSSTDKLSSMEKGWLWLVTAVNEGQTNTQAYLAGKRNPSIFSDIKLDISAC